MALRDDPRRTQLVGLATASVTATLIVGLFAFATGDPWGEEHVTLTAHFATVSGLKKNSDVLLSGKKIGRVDNVAFVTSRYGCNADTEDLGRESSDDCEPWFFCGREPDGDHLCGEVLPYTGSPADYEDKGCLVDEQCQASEVCFNPDFRRRNPGVDWYGPKNTCVPYQVDHHRVEVTLAIQPDKLAFISTDSRVTVASKGPLGDQQVNIDVGSGTPVAPGQRLQTEPTLLQELNHFRERIGAVTDRFSGNLASVRELRGSLKSEDENPSKDLRTQLERVSDATDDVVGGRGQLGELFEAGARDDFMTNLADLRRTSDQTRRDLASWRRKNVRGLHDVGQKMQEFADSSFAATDPSSDATVARLFMDERLGLDTAERVSTTTDNISGAKGKLDDVQEAVDDLRRELDGGEGLFGELVRDPALYYRLVKAVAMFDMLDRNDGLKALARDVMAAGDEYEDADPERDRVQVRAPPAPASAPEPVAPPPPKRGPPPPPPPGSPDGE